jgi:hypothetical protein
MSKILYESEQNAYFADEAPSDEAIGLDIIALLNLRLHGDFVETSHGTKTPVGLSRTIKRIIAEHREEKPVIWVQFTKRTEDPKLSAIERMLTIAGIRHKREGESWHAPILMVEADKLGDASMLLHPIDEIPDDDERWEALA